MDHCPLHQAPTKAQQSLVVGKQVFISGAKNMDFFPQPSRCRSDSSAASQAQAYGTELGNPRTSIPELRVCVYGGDSWVTSGGSPGAGSFSQAPGHSLQR